MAATPTNFRQVFLFDELRRALLALTFIVPPELFCVDIRLCAWARTSGDAHARGFIALEWKGRRTPDALRRSTVRTALNELLEGNAGGRLPLTGLKRDRGFRC